MVTVPCRPSVPATARGGRGAIARASGTSGSSPGFVTGVCATLGATLATTARKGVGRPRTTISARPARPATCVGTASPGSALATAAGSSPRVEAPVTASKGATVGVEGLEGQVFLARGRGPPRTCSTRRVTAVTPNGGGVFGTTPVARRRKGAPKQDALRPTAGR